MSILVDHGGVCKIEFFILFEKSILNFVMICMMCSGISFSVLFLVSLAAKLGAILILRIQRGVR
jgi:hypothetical protein